MAKANNDKNNPHFIQTTLGRAKARTHNDSSKAIAAELAIPDSEEDELSVEDLYFLVGGESGY